MKRVIEISAKSREEAQQLANQELDSGEKVTNSEVLSAPAKGMFGIVGNPEYRVRFTIESVPTALDMVEPEVDGSDEDYEEVAEEETEGEAEDEATGEAEELEEEFAEESKEGVSPKSFGNSRFSSEFAGKENPGYEEIFGLLKEIAENIGVEGSSFTERIEDDVWKFDASGENISQLIGKHGRTLDAIQYLINIIANKGLEERRVKILLDVQGYRDQRQKGLVKLANRMYRKVIDSGRQVELEPMSTIDRRTIHLTLKDRSGIETFSKGVEPLRRVVISPKKAKDRTGWRTPREAKPDRPSQPPSRPKSVPMFMEEEGSNED